MGFWGLTLDVPVGEVWASRVGVGVQVLSASVLGTGSWQNSISGQGQGKACWDKEGSDASGRTGLRGYCEGKEEQPTPFLHLSPDFSMCPPPNPAATSSQGPPSRISRPEPQPRLPSSQPACLPCLLRPPWAASDPSTELSLS